MTKVNHQKLCSDYHIFQFLGLSLLVAHAKNVKYLSYTSKRMCLLLNTLNFEITFMEMLTQCETFVV